MNPGIKRPFRFLTNEEFHALDVKGKAVYLVRAQQELEEQQESLRTYRETLTVQLAAMLELRGDVFPENDTRQ